MQNNSNLLGFGGFLLGLGIGWLIFTALNVSLNLFAWLLIIIGVATVIGGLVSFAGLSLPIGNVIGSFSGGLILALFLTSGFQLFSDFGIWDGSGDYKAEDMLIFTGTALQDRVYFECDNFNGPVTVNSWEKNEYDVSLKIKAKGRTVQAAENLIDGLDIELDENQVSGQLRLILAYDIPSTQRPQLSIEVTVNLPSDADIGLQVESSNGAIHLSNINGSGIFLDTSNGGLNLVNVFAENIDASTSNGRIQGTFEAPAASLSTSNGGIDVNIPGNIAATYIFETSNGGVDVKLTRTTDIGFDLEVTSSNGDIDINLPNLDYSTNTKNRKVAKTEDYALKNVKINLEISTSNGNVDVYS